MENFLRSRVQSRLDALGINPFEAARRAGGERTFINDLLIGKKDSIRRSALPRVAEALDCDPEYLLGAQDAPRRGHAAHAKSPETAPGTAPLVGIAEAGTWRLTGRAGPSPALPIAPDPRHPASAQVAYLVRGDHASAIGATDGAVVVGVTGANYRQGDVVAVRRTRDLGEGREEEITIRRANGAWLECQNEDGSTSRVAAESAEILARAISAYKVF